MRWPVYQVIAFLGILVVSVAVLAVTRLAPATPQLPNGALDIVAQHGDGGSTGSGGQLPAWLDGRLDTLVDRLGATVDAAVQARMEQAVARLGSKVAAGKDLSLAAAPDAGIQEEAPPALEPMSLPRPAEPAVAEQEAATAVQPAREPLPPPPAPPPVAASIAASASMPGPGVVTVSERPTEVPGKDCEGYMVHAAPKEWCGKKKSDHGGSSCLSHYEVQYLEEHAEKLKPGLAALRKPGCFPHGLSVATMGYFRTGSTLLYNVARLWAALGAGKALVSGFQCKDPTMMGIGVKGTSTARCSVVCKDHEIRAGVPGRMAVMLMSRRDPWESVCSRKLMDLWCRLRQQGRQKQASKEEKDAYSSKCRSDEAMQAVEAQNQCKDLMKMQANIYHARRQQGREVAYDVLLSDYSTSPEVPVMEIGKALGICKEAYADPALVKLVVAMGTHLHDHPDKDMGITQMHDVHSDKQRQAKCSKLAEWMAQDPECGEWMAGNASAAANSILRKMDASWAKQNKGKL